MKDPFELTENDLFHAFENLFDTTGIEDLNPNMDDFEDALHAWACSLFSENVSIIESQYPWLKGYDNDGEMWYDHVQDDVIFYYMDEIIKLNFKG